MIIKSLSNSNCVQLSETTSFLLANTDWWRHCAKP